MCCRGPWFSNSWHDVREIHYDGMNCSQHLDNLVERLPGCPGEDELVMILKMILMMILMIDDLVEREPGCPGEDVLPGGTSPLETSPAQNLCSHLLWLFDEVLIPGK